MQTQKITFSDKTKEPYKIVCVDTEKVLESWRLSVFSIDWLDSTGCIRPPEKMVEAEREKRRTVEAQIQNGEILERPLLGIGLQDNIEIGRGAAVFLTLAALGHKEIPVYISPNISQDIAPFLI